MSQEPDGERTRSVPPTAVLSGAGVQGFSPLPTGTRIGELTVQSVLGAGEFGITYLTEHEKRSKRYVLKEYFPRAIAFRDGRAVRARPETSQVYTWGLERFLSEARSLQEVRHPGVCSVLGVTKEGGTGYVGMAYEQGVDFGIWLHERKRIAPQEDLDPLIGPLLDAVSTVHAAKILHLDITPDGLIIRETGGPVLVDFGLYRVGVRRRLPAGDLSRLVYAAPELLATGGGPIGPWTDIYSLAGLLYLAVAGRPPLSVVERVKGASLPSAASVAKGKYRADFLHAIDAGLRLEPAQRPRSAEDWSKSLLRPAGSRFSVARWLPTSQGGSAPATVSRPEPAKPAVSREETVSLGGTPVEAKSPAAAPATAPVGPTARGTVQSLATWGAAGLGLGAFAGALIGYAAAAVLRSDCSDGSCSAQLALPLAIIGAAVGVWEAIRFVRNRENFRLAQTQADI